MRPRIAIVVALAAAFAAGRASGQAADPVPAAGVALSLAPDLTPPADTGKPRVFQRPPLDLPGGGCDGLVDCRLRLIGRLPREGAVELNATALRW
ncbi:MAG TPA: hypothetical protein VMB84_17045 [Stellaceae bacterium]|nr:hypothetical protein [Stellaceae bacterium]